MSPAGVAELLAGGEFVLATASVAAFHSSKSDVFDVKDVVRTVDRCIAVSQRRVLKKRYEISATWPLAYVSSRINPNESQEMGPYPYNITSFATDGETVTAGFRSRRDRGHFTDEAPRILAEAIGW